MSILWKNMPVHNLIGHPLCEIVYWAVRPISKTKAKYFAGRVHDSTLPAHCIEEWRHNV